MTRLLVIDDDFNLFTLLAEYLSEEGFACTHAPDGDRGLELLAAERWDIAILDVMLPGKNGFAVLERLRAAEATAALPVLMLTARGEESDKVTGLEMGADDYLAKPFGPMELVARLRALLRRAAQSGAPVAPAEGGDTIRLDDITLAKHSLSISVDNRQTSISVSEMRLLELFAEAPGTVISRNRLYDRIFGHPPFPQDRSLDMLVSRLRKKLGLRPDGGERIRAARGEGYIFLLSGDSA
ncbi:MAG: response regulator transcription factor [Planctomycetes bacterium]|nr:response regulator transcription factor [Planctomycetota bacterium]